MRTTPTPLTKAQLEKEISLFKKQDHSLDGPKAIHLSEEDKNTLRGYYQDQIIRRMKTLNTFVNRAQMTAQASSMAVTYQIVTP